MIRSLSGRIEAVFLCAVALVLATRTSAQEKIQFKFDPGHPEAPGVIPVWPTNFYSDLTGYGFEPDADVVAAGGCITSTNPFYFSIKLPEGNYRVTVDLGDPAAVSSTTLKAELRRLMVYHVQAVPGRFVTCSFIVNVRTPQITGGAEVRLKPREQTSEWWDWDNKLTLEFNDAHPSVRSLTVARVAVPTIFILGDSTVCDQPVEPWDSWGQMLPVFFKPDIAVANHAESGETVADSFSRNRFAKVFSLMRPGDFLFIQFGHNDMKNKNPAALDQYKTDLKKVIADTRAKGGTPVLVTPMERKAGVEHPTLAGYPEAVREVAGEEHCPLIDLSRMSLVFYQALGTNLDKAFVDGTHHNNYGSFELAKCVVEATQQLRLPLAKHIVDDFKGFDPAHPDPVETFYMPVSPKYSMAKPLGN
jgi:lysophospholipase L1-like esterase